MLDSFWRAAMYCLHPRVIALSILPLVIMAALSLGLGYFFWDDTLAAIRSNLESYEMVSRMVHWLESLGLSGLRLVLAPALLLALAIPVVVISSLLFVAVFMTPAMVSLVAERRFPALERKKGGSMLTSVLWSLGSTVVAAIALLISIPLWLIPPLILILPPLIWGWLTYRVMSYDALVDHASADERKQIFKNNRMSLLAIFALLVSIPLWLIPPLILILPPLIWGWLTYRVMAYDALADHASVEERREIFKTQRMPLLAIGVLSGYLGRPEVESSGLFSLFSISVFAFPPSWVRGS